MTLKQAFVDFLPSDIQAITPQDILSILDMFPDAFGYCGLDDDANQIVVYIVSHDPDEEDETVWDIDPFARRDLQDCLDATGTMDDYGIYWFNGFSVIIY